jgi:uncharacterized membrane protein YdjX (TVP38/TMEM64 family)
LSRSETLKRLLPLFVLLGLVAGFFALGLNRYLTLQALHEHEAALRAIVSRRPVFAAVGFVAIYALVVALSLPGGAIMTMTGGFLFGLWLGSLFAVLGATAGAIILFLVARFAVGDLLRARASPFLKRMAEGFGRNAFSYLLFLRLVPLFPFWAVNLVPAFLGIRLRSFVGATLIGIIPGTLAYASIGDSLGIYFNAGSDVPLSKVFTPETIAMRLGLALLALLPMAIQWARRRQR